MDLGLAGKKALITGATKGIGRTVAETLLAEGASVAICARNAEGVEKAVEEMSSLGTVVGEAVDAADGEAVAAWVASSAEQLGGIDIYVHNTSGNGREDPRRLDGQLQHRHDVARARRRRREGSARRRRRIGDQHRHHRHGRTLRLGFQQLLRVQVGRDQLDARPGPGARQEGMRCNVVSPGPIFVEGGDWNMIKDHMADFYEATEKTHPGGELGTMQDVANVVAFLASDAANHVNGVNVTVDGGFLKRVDF